MTDHVDLALLAGSILVVASALYLYGTGADHHQATQDGGVDAVCLPTSNPSSALLDLAPSPADD